MKLFKYTSRQKLNTPSLVPRFRTGTNTSDISASKQCSAYLQSSQHRMAQSMPFSIAFAPLIVNCLSYCSADNLYCVTPTAISCSSCPQNSTHCNTLSEYGELHFTSNTTIWCSCQLVIPLIDTVAYVY